MKIFDPWCEIDNDSSIHLTWCDLPEHTGGTALITTGSISVVYLDPALEGPEQRDALAHELVHHEVT